MKEISIRIAKPQDARQIQNILYINRTTSPYYKKIFGDDLKKCDVFLNEESIQKKEQQIKELGDERFFMVAEDDKEKIIMGMCSGSLYSQSIEMQNTLKNIHDYAEVKGLYIDPQYHNKGLGSELIKEFEKRVSSKGGDKIIIKTLSENIQSNNFYQKQGYQLTSYHCDFTRRDITTQCNIYTKDL